MTQARPFGTFDLVLLLLVLAAAAGVRVGYLLYLAENGHKAGPLVVQDRETGFPGSTSSAESETSTELERLAESVRQSQAFEVHAPFAAQEEKTAHYSPGYPWLLGWLGRLVPVESVPFWMRWIQVGLGSLTAGLYFLFARRAFRSRTVGLLAGLLTALHPFWIVGVGAIADGVVAAFLLGLVLFLAARAGETGGALASLLLGVTLAGLSLVRAALLPFSFAVVIWFLWRSRSLPRGWLAGVLVLLGFLNGLAPWTVRNFQLFNEPVPVVDSAYVHLWIGNNPHATGGPVTEAMVHDAPVAELQKVSHQPQRYAMLAKEVWREMHEQPTETVRRRLRAEIIFFTGEAWLADGTVAKATGDMPDWLRNSYPVTFQSVLLGMLVLAFFGWRWSYGWRWSSMPMTLAMIWIPLLYFLGHGETLVGPRLPLDGVLLTYAAFTLATCSPRARHSLLEAPGAGPVAPTGV
jgi:4-amino-4-deoxy-L-arabinose transferase-like glycosyltransferase